MNLIRWCTSCGKDSVRCKCKVPVLYCEMSKVEIDEDEPPRRVAINDKTNPIKFRYGRGS